MLNERDNEFFNLIEKEIKAFAKECPDESKFKGSRYQKGYLRGVLSTFWKWFKFYTENPPGALCTKIDDSMPSVFAPISRRLDMLKPWQWWVGIGATAIGEIFGALALLDGKHDVGLTIYSMVMSLIPAALVVCYGKGKSKENTL